jgi:uncharacterized protein (DUF302 family)
MSSSAFSIPVDVGLPFEQTLERVTQALAAEGFGVLSTIDVAGTLKKKLDVDVPRYTILGACNPGFAHKALQAVEDIGILLPCNVVVQEVDPTHSRVFLTRVESVFTLVDADGMADIASEVGRRMQSIAEAIAL